ncbi:hypothetical protein LJR230_000011 [Trinickia sp. LjRoot230]|uniref:hypothetical protein n=1 Tax=Trinickia sp. LjRoot230 TaxID=3342288 RepID=UPI003ECFFBFE
MKTPRRAVALRAMGPPELSKLSLRQLDRVVRRVYGLDQRTWVTSDPLDDPASGRIMAVPAELGPLTDLMRLPNLKALEQIVGGYVDARFVHALIVSNRMAELSSQPDLLRAVVYWWATRVAVRMTRGPFDKEEFVDAYIEQVREAMAREGIQRLPFPHLRELRIAEALLRRVGAETFWKGPFRGGRASIEQIKRAARDALSRHFDEPDVVVLGSATGLAKTPSAVGVDDDAADLDDAAVLKRLGKRASQSMQSGTVQAHQTCLRALGVWLRQNHPERGGLAAIEQADQTIAERWVNEYRDAIGRLSTHGTHINGAVAALRGEPRPKQSRTLRPGDRAVLEQFGRAAAAAGLVVGVVKTYQADLRKLSRWLNEYHPDQRGLTGVESGDVEAVGTLLQAFRETNQAPGIDDALNALRSLRQGSN